MKSQNFRDVQKKYQEEVVGLCLICQKPVKGGYYGSWQAGGTCSRACEISQESKNCFIDKWPFIDEVIFDKGDDDVAKTGGGSDADQSGR